MLVVVEYMVMGVCAGLLSGLLGIGGGLVVVPGLVWVLRQQGFPSSIIMHFAVGTSLTVMVLTTCVSMLAHQRKGMDVKVLYRKLVKGIVIGVVVGASVGHVVHGQYLRAMFGVFVVCLAVRTVRHMYGAHDKTTYVKPWWPLSVGVGMLSGMFGIGAGVMAPMLMTRGVAVRQAVAVCAACSMTVAVFGSMAAMGWGMQQPYHPAYSVGYVLWPAVLGVALTSPLAAWVGAWLSHQLSTTALQWALVLLLLVVGSDMLWPTVQELWHVTIPTY